MEGGAARRHSDLRWPQARAGSEKSITLYIEKSNAEGHLTVYDHIAGGSYRYAEPMDEIVWQIEEDSVKKNPWI